MHTKDINQRFIPSNRLQEALQKSEGLSPIEKSTDLFSIRDGQLLPNLVTTRYHFDIGADANAFWEILGYCYSDETFLSQFP